MLKEKKDKLEFLLELEKIIESRKHKNSKNSYVSKILTKGMDKILQKLGEECVEYIIDTKNQKKTRAIEEGADMLFHFLISLSAQDLSILDIIQELKKRH